MNENTIKETLLENLKTIGKIETREDHDLEAIDIFGEGYVTSLSLVSYIRFLESSFNILIDEDYLYDDRFVNIIGQTEIILEILENRQEST